MPRLTTAESVARALLRKALKGDVQAIKEVADRTEGKPRQSVDVDLSVTNWREMAGRTG